MKDDVSIGKQLFRSGAIIFFGCAVLIIGLYYLRGVADRETEQLRQDAYGAGFQDGQIEALNYLLQNGYTLQEIGEDGVPYFTALGKKYNQVISEIIYDRTP